MKRIILSMFCIVAGLTGLAAQSRPLASFFPELAGWQKSGNAEIFLPDNLYEHINGAAENFLSYDFRQLAVQNYAKGQKQSLSAEIYFHGTLENAFGIYSSEKPLAGDYFAIGSQGYAEAGVLNFISDAYYVKLVGFDLGTEGQEVLLGLAREIAAAIGGSNALPSTLSVFPSRGRITHSERFIADNFLGHDFLPSAFTADYELQGQKFQLFIMKFVDEKQARAALQRYAALDREKPVRAVEPGTWTIQDPYNGPIRLSWLGIHIWGINGQTPAASAYLEAIAMKLAAQ